MIGFISDSVTERDVGWQTRVVEEIDCNWLEIKIGGQRNCGFLGRPRGLRIKGTHTKYFHAWSYTQFSLIIYWYVETEMTCW